MLRSLIFNIAFYGYTALACFFLMWSFVLPRRWALFAVMLYFKGIIPIERHIMKLDYRVSGYENIPQTGSYVIAMKHQSAYETLKLLPIFGNIAVVFKRSLAWIPFWGWYMLKTGMIPVDRGARGKAMSSLVEGARDVIAAGRPIVIFPQGTRVDVGVSPAEKPYKYGVIKIAETLKLPILPVALNSGVFWGRNAFRKRSGIVDFKILPPISSDQSSQAIMEQLQTVLEKESDILAANAAINAPIERRPRRVPAWVKIYVITILAVAVLWTAYWYSLAHALQNGIDRMLAQQDGTTKISSPFRPEIEGFPGAITLTWPSIHYESPQNIIDIGALEVRAVPLPAAPLIVNAAAGIRIQLPAQNQRVDFETLNIEARLPRIWQPKSQWAMHVKTLALSRGASQVEAKGDFYIPIDPSQPFAGNMNAVLAGYGDLAEYVVDLGLVDERSASMARGFMDAMAAAQGTPGRLTAPLNVKDDWVYVGPMRAFYLRPALPDSAPAAGNTIESIQATPTPAVRAPVEESGSTPPQNRPAGSGSSSPLDLNPQSGPSNLVPQ